MYYSRNIVHPKNIQQTCTVATECMHVIAMAGQEHAHAYESEQYVYDGIKRWPTDKAINTVSCQPQFNHICKSGCYKCNDQRISLEDLSTSSFVYQGVLVFQVSLHNNVSFGTTARCVDYLQYIYSYHVLGIFCSTKFL